MSGWGVFFGKIADQFQGRTERLKNERVRLVVELDRLMKLECTDAVAKKTSFVITRINQIDNILINNAKD